jgi:raffinose/stachyose/melibiose transport system permease protein
MKRKAKVDPVVVGLWLSLVVIAVIWIAPFFFVLMTSLKTRPDLIKTGAFGLPTQIAWENFSKAWNRADLSTTALNSAIISFTKVPIGLLISSLAAFALTRMRFRYQQALFMLFVAGTLIPVQ